MAKKVLVVLSGHEYWGGGLIGPLEPLNAADYDTDFVTPDKIKRVEKPDRLGKPDHLCSWFPERSCSSAPLLVRELENWYNKRDQLEPISNCIPRYYSWGHSGSTVDMVHNQ
jgi:hypothetical protein